MSKHTLNGTRRKVIKTSGFRARLATQSGRTILQNRRRRGRWKLSITSGQKSYTRKESRVGKKKK